MDDRQQIESLYNKMYEAMVNKNAEAIARCLADDFTLTDAGFFLAGEL